MSGSKTLSNGELKAWLIDRIAFYLDKPTSGIAPDVELARYGVDSVYALSIISDIEDHLQIEVDLEQARRLTTVDEMAGYLQKLVA